MPSSCCALNGGGAAELLNWEGGGGYCCWELFTPAFGLGFPPPPGRVLAGDLEEAAALLAFDSSEGTLPIVQEGAAPTDEKR